jgi:hypothetical protein
VDSDRQPCLVRPEALKGGNSRSNSGVPRVESSLALYIQSEALQGIAFYLLAVRVRPRCSQDQLF